MSGIACPTYRSGFYSPRRGGVAKFPDMWPNCYMALAPCLGQTGDRIIDQSGRQNHAGLVGTYSWPSDWSRQDGQEALRVYNTGPSYISIPFANASSFTNAGSLILWISRWGTTSGNEGAWVISSNGSLNHYPYSGTIYDGTFCTARQTVGASIVDITSGNIPLHSIAITFGGGVYSFYQNGRRIYTASGLTFDPPESTLRIGNNSSDYKSLALHEARLYNICLTPAQVRRFTLRPGQAYEIDYRRRSRSVVASAPIAVTPSTATIVTTAFAPTVSTPRLVTPATAVLSLTTLAPSVSAPRTVTPPAASLALTGFAPTVSAPLSVTPPAASLVLTGFVPTVSATGAVTPPTATLSLTTFAPTVTTPRTVTSPTGALSLTAFAPVVSSPRTVTPAAMALSLTRFAPTIYSGKTATPPTATLTLTTFAAAVLTPRVVTPPTTSLTLTRFAPAVSSGNPQFRQLLFLQGGLFLDRSTMFLQG